MKNQKLLVDSEGDARKALEELRATLYSIGDGVIVTDTACKITRINPVAGNLTGWSEPEAVGKHLDDVFCIVNEKSGAKIANPAERVLREGTTVGLANDTLLIARDGTARPIADCGAPIFNEQRAIIGVVLVFHDQTAERTAKQALQDSEERFRTVADYTYDWEYWCAPDGKILYISPSCERITGYPPAEFIADPSLLERIIHPEDRGAWEQHLLLDTTHERELIFRILRHDGNTRWIGHVCQFIYSADGTNLGLRVSNRDITERNQAEEERKAYIWFLENLERIDKVIKKETDVDQLLWATIKEVLAILECDRAWLLYPCDPEAATFRVPVELCRPEYPGAEELNIEVPMKPGADQVCATALATDGPVIYGPHVERPVYEELTKHFGVLSQMTVAVYPKMGKPWLFGLHQCSHARVWTQAEQRLFNEIGRRISDGLSSVLFLRELQENEERFRATFEQAAVGIAHGALDGRCLRVNQKLCDIVGYEREELLQKKFQDITHPDDLQRSLASIHQVLAGEIQSYNQEKRYIRKDGSIVWIDQTVSIVRQVSGQPSYFISVIEDISNRKQAEEEKEKLRGQLLQSQKIESIGRLAGGVAHDFNNMLGVILGHAELALHRIDQGHPLFAGLIEIQKAGRRASALTRQLLAFARKQVVSPKVLDLNNIVAGMLSMIRRLIGEDIELVWIPGEEVQSIKIDPSQIDQILANLCINARDAIIGVGKITIETKNIAFDEMFCSIHEGFVPGQYVQLTVSDNGCGMEKEILANLFEPFFTTKVVGKGTGLGLSTVYGIVKQNRGFINVYSEPKKGTTFKIYLPHYKDKQEETTIEAPVQITAGGLETILLVEDEQALLNLSRIMLEELGYRVLTAATPGEALQLAAEHAGKIDIVVTDVVMPEMNGRDLCKRLLSLYPNLKRLFMSGYTANVIVHHGVLEEGVCFIQKPFSQKNLSLKVREALEKL